MLEFDAFIVIVVLVFIIISLYKDIIGPAFTFIIAITVLGVFQILTPSEILHGFANEQVAVILMLLLVGDLFTKTEIIESIFDRIFKKAKSPRGFLVRMMIWVGSFSAFLNNTPLVAMMIPYVHTWSKKNNISASKFLIPLSYAAILGGMVTLIGTSTNLIVSGFVIEQNIIEDLKPLNIFDFAWVGLPMFIVGFIYLVFIGYRILPEGKDILSKFKENSREYIVEAEVRSNSGLIGKTITEAGLRNLKGLYLYEIIRKDKRIKAVTHNELIREDDHLFFAGDTENIAEMLNLNSGLTLPLVGMLAKKKHTEVVEVVVSHNSSLITKTVKEANFRGKYDAAIIAIHRNGERVKGKLGSIELKAGDVLLILAGDDLSERAQDSQDFYFISKVKEFNRLDRLKSTVLVGGLILAVILKALGLVSLFMIVLCLLLLLTALKIASAKDIYKNFDYNLAIIIAMALALGTAMTKSGVAEMAAETVISAFKPFGNISLLFGIYILTSLLASFVTNKAAVAIVFPISLTMASTLGLNPMPFILIVAYAAAANFMIPIGYQTNLMVYGPGGYTLKDFIKIGFPLTFIYMIGTVLILNLVFL